MAQSGRLVVCGDAGDGARRLALRGAHLRPRRGRRPRRRLHREGDARRAPGRAARAARRAPGSATLDGRFRRYGSARRALQLPPRQRRRATDERARHRTPASGLRESATFDRNAIAEIQRAAREGIYDIRGLRRQAPRAALRRPAASSARACRATRSRATASAAPPTSCSAPATPSKPIELADPDHDRRHELRRALSAGQGGARPRRHRGRHEHDDRRRRDDPRGAAALARRSSTRCCRRATA